ncbi:TOTE conflict system archaeo-eukaryotic primase domain-containing protein [Thalassomonas viridans]|uniref:TOTE conflict system archaeo-eukaryotic primase domain-containing protein n=1 Tax=Thalassomonas viridans TaxID=137584 RepID=UPI001F31BF23|nr:hypothetical protein [Thalassomonas viridans]
MQRKTELESIELRLVQLEQERKHLLLRKQALISAMNDERRVVVNFTPEQKVHIFAELFRGRTDIYANRWQNKQQRSGYSVACHNEWQQGKCHKPKVKCTECSYQAFKRLDHQAIYQHLSGKQSIGLYPLLEDDHCWLLVVDFDKSDWREAVTAFRKACHEWQLPCSVEISRSGNGAHVWLFFDSPLLARDVRQLGFSLLDKAMSFHAGLSFESYDRLFPNQDVLPVGGFGNLIALPLQYGPRQNGNSVFVDEEFHAYFDQWGYLAAIEKVTLKQVESCLNQKEMGIQVASDLNLGKCHSLAIRRLLPAALWKLLWCWQIVFI